MKKLDEKKSCKILELGYNISMRYPPKTVLETRDHDSPGADPTYLLRRIVRGQWSNRNLVSSGPRGCNGWLCSLLRQTIVGLSPQSAGSSGLFPA